MDATAAANIPLNCQDVHTALCGNDLARASTSQGILSRAVPSVPSAELGQAKGHGFKNWLRALVFGLINAVVLVPVMVGFAQVIFRDPFFAAYRPLLVKAVLFSSIVHQSVFSLTSSLTFAVGQVQDAGLIFLSAMASACVQAINSGDDAEIVSTTLVTLSLATTLLGVALVLTGMFNLATFVQYLPQPVVSGYLAFIGLFCFQAGLGLMTAEPIENLGQWSRLFHWEPVRLLTPGVILGVILYFLLRRFHHFAVLPSLLLLIPVGFFAVLLCTGVSLQEARDQGWVDRDTSIEHFWHIWKLFDFSKVRWYTMFRQIPTWFGMYFVVAFSSCLDVAAIQFDLGKALDFNHELKTVGVSNIVSGITGGFTGSYIFSQTIFTMRSAVESRMIGLVIIICEICIFVLPFSILAYVPRLFFGAILTFIAVDLIIEHLVESYQKTNASSYGIAWATFLAINVFGLEFGMLVGVGITALHFMFEYVRFGHLARRVPARSRVFRGFAQRKLLEQRSHEIVALEISGYIFFGSALKLFEEIKSRILVPVVQPRTDHPQLVPLSAAGGRVTDVRGCDGQTSFLLLDFARVSGVDITAAGSCFKPLKQLLQDHAIPLLFTNVHQGTMKVLESQGVLLHGSRAIEPRIENDVCTFESFDHGIEWCESILLRRHGEDRISTVEASAAPRNGLAHTLSRTPSGANRETHALENDGFAALEQYFVRVEIPAGNDIFSVGDTADAMYVIEFGEVVLTTKTATRVQRYVHGGIFGDLDLFLQRPRSFAASAVTDCVVWKLSQSNLSRIASGHPNELAMLHHAVLQSLCLSASGMLDDYFRDCV